MNTSTSLPSVTRPARPGAFFLLGLALLAIAPGLQAQDLSTSMLRLEQMQAQGGDIEAQFALGARYEDGNGIEPDLGEAIRWYTEAAEGGHTEAQFKLGHFYEQGRGVAADPAKAKGWFELAATNGHAGARQHLAAKERERIAAEAREAQRAMATTAPRPAPRPAPAPAPRREPAPAKPAAPKPAPTPPPPARPAMPDIRDVVVNGQWSATGVPALFLPSATTRCLVSGEDVVCFSSEQTRGLDGQDVTFTTKATLSGFDPEGRFGVNYIYNVTDVDRRGNSGGVVPPGLRAEEGWLEPGRSLRCEAASRTELRCAGSGETHVLRTR